jgi:hypothetical protein
MTTVVSLLRRGESEPRLVNPKKSMAEREIEFGGGKAVKVVDTNGTAAEKLGTEQTRVNFPTGWEYVIAAGDSKRVFELPGKKEGQSVLLIQAEAEVRFTIPLSASAPWGEMIVIRK